MAAAPSFVSQGTRATSASAATITPALPASRTANNILIAVCSATTTGKTISVGGGWNIVGNVNTNISSVWAWRLVDGAEAAPVFTWTGNSACSGVVYQYTGNLTVGPIGANSQRQGPTGGTVMTATSQLVTTASSSLVIGIGTWSASAAASQTAGGNYTVNATQFGTGPGDATLSGPVYTSGSTSDVCSLTIATGVGAYAFFEIELLGNGPTTNEPQTRASQVVQQVLYSYSNPTNVRASQVVLQVLRTDNPSKERSQVYIIGKSP